MSILGRVLSLGLVLAVSGAIFAQNPPACGVKCGSDRWTLKTLIDIDVQNVDFTSIQKKTVAQLTALPKPNKRPKLNRVPPTELQTFEVEANLTEFGAEKDRDLHIVIADVGVPSKTMVIEIPRFSVSGCLCISAFGRIPGCAKSVYHALRGTDNKIQAGRSSSQSHGEGGGIF